MKNKRQGKPTKHQQQHQEIRIGLVNPASKMTFVSVEHSTGNRRRTKDLVGQQRIAQERYQKHNLRLHNANPFSWSNFEAFQSTTWLSSESLPIGTTVPSTTATVFEPIIPDVTALLGFGAVVAISVVAAIVWNTQVVPISRTKLALSKKSGEVKDYLDELRDDEVTVDRKFERWLFTDWLQKSKMRKDPALPILTKAKWNSGDNPVLAATALIALGVIGSSIIEKLATSM
jgi:hypothetical protein